MKNNDAFALVLRTNRADGTSRNGFKWPKRGKVECPDWEPTPECGHGLHGLLNGEGNEDLLNWSNNSQWRVVRVLKADIVDLKGKVKFPRGYVVFTGDRAGATRYLWERVGAGHAIHGLFLCSASKLVAMGGRKSILIGGGWSTIAGGDNSMLTGGDNSMLTGGGWSTITGGDRSTITGGYGSTITGGAYSTITGGEESSASCRWWDRGRWRTKTFYEGEDYVAGKKYQFQHDNGKCKLVEVEK